MSKDGTVVNVISSYMPQSNHDAIMSIIKI